MIEIALKCCTCGKTKNVIVSNKPEFSFEFYGMIAEAGWNPILDLNHGRTLCFCSKECYEKQLTKSGVIRKKLIHIGGDTI